MRGLLGQDTRNQAVGRNSNSKPFDSDQTPALQISTYEVEEAISRLMKLELLKIHKGKLIQTEANLTTTFDVPSDALKEFHRQLLKKAQDALTLQSVEERSISSITIAIAEHDVPIFKERIKDFIFNMNEETESKDSPKDEVYCLGIQFFRLTER